MYCVSEEQRSAFIRAASSTLQQQTTQKGRVKSFGDSLCAVVCSIWMCGSRCVLLRILCIRGDCIGVENVKTRRKKGEELHRDVIASDAADSKII